MAAVKTFKPPMVWSTEARAVVEDRRYKQWSKEQVRSMKNGTYDWATHEEKRAS